MPNIFIRNPASDGGDRRIRLTKTPTSILSIPTIAGAMVETTDEVRLCLTTRRLVTLTFYEEPNITDASNVVLNGSGTFHAGDTLEIQVTSDKIGDTTETFNVTALVDNSFTVTRNFSTFKYKANLTATVLSINNSSKGFNKTDAVSQLPDREYYPALRVSNTSRTTAPTVQLTRPQAAATGAETIMLTVDWWDGVRQVMAWYGGSTTYNITRAGINLPDVYKWVEVRADKPLLTANLTAQAIEYYGLQINHPRHIGVIESIVDHIPPNITSLANSFSNVTSPNAVFAPLLDWDVSNVTDFSNTFSQATQFNQPIGNWDVSKGTIFSGMFSGTTSFNQPLNTWNLGNATDISFMFSSSVFNQDISSWDVSKVFRFSGMFRYNAAFNQPLNTWDTSSAGMMTWMFQNASSFNQPIGNWDVSHVVDMKFMFQNATSFNQPIGNWDVGSTIGYAHNLMYDGGYQFDCLDSMFTGATAFNQDLTQWCVPMYGGSVIERNSRFGSDSGLAAQNYPVWGTCPIPTTQMTIRGVEDLKFINDTTTLTLEVTPTPRAPVTINYTDKLLVWSVMDENVATINATTGQITLIGEGTTTVKARMNNFYETTVEISAQPLPFTLLTYTDVSIPLMIANQGEIGVLADWGDGNSETIAAGATVSHTYANPSQTAKFLPVTGTEMPRLQVMQGVSEVVDWYSGLQPSISFASATITKVPNVAPRGFENAHKLFFGCPMFNQDISTWDVSNVTDFSYAFAESTGFNQPLNTWDTTSATTMAFMFYNMSYNQDIAAWNVSNVTNFESMFASNSAFNQDISGWDTTAALSMKNMFWGAVGFRQNLDSWNVGTVTDFSGMFKSLTSYNQPLGNWDVSSGTAFQNMFDGCSTFNQSLEFWNVGNMVLCSQMFYNCSTYNQPMSLWDVSKVTEMSNMFEGATAFNQDLSLWCVSNLPSEPVGFATSSGLTPAFKPMWGTCPARPTVVTIKGVNVTAMEGQLVNAGYSITPAETITSVAWTSSNTAVATIGATTGTITYLTAGTVTFTLTLNGTHTQTIDVTVAVADYEPMRILTAGEVGEAIGFTNNGTVPVFIDYGNGETYTLNAGGSTYGQWYDGVVRTVTIKPVSGYKLAGLKIDSSCTEVVNWYGGQTPSVKLNCYNLTKVPNTSPMGLTDASDMFRNSLVFNQDISGWDMSNVTNMYQMFNGCPMFNQPIGTWNISKVTNIAGMFKGCTTFNQPLGDWNTSKVTEAAQVFYSAEAFNQNLSQWCVLLAEPYQFAYNTKMSAGNLPVWRTCPRGENLV